LKATLKDGILNLTIETLEVNGRPVPKEFMDALNQSSLEFSKDPDFANRMRKFDSLEVKDGKIIINGRGTKTGKEPAASPSMPDLPDDVLAPADASPRP
jgi:hypothetical protein